MFRKIALLLVLLLSFVSGRATAGWQMASQQLPPAVSLYSDFDPLHGRLYLSNGVQYWQVDVETGAARGSAIPPSPALSFTIEAMAFHPSRAELVFTGRATRYDSPSQTLVDSVVVTRTSVATGQSTQSRLPRRAPSLAAAPFAVLDAPRDRILFWGGMLGDTLWSLTLADEQWQQIAIGGTHPPLLTGMLTALDPAHDRALVYGKNAGVTSVWSLGLGASPAWAPVPTIGPTPLATSGRMFVDLIENRLVVVGGNNVALSTDFPAVREVSTLALDAPTTPAWNVLRPWVQGQSIDDGSALYGPSVAMDVTTGRLWSYGGALVTPPPNPDISGMPVLTPTQETVRLDLHGFSHWQASPTFGPPTLSEQVVARDPVSGRCFVAGTGNQTELHELFTGGTNGGGYRLLTPPLQQIPDRLYRKKLLVDVPRRQLLLIGSNLAPAAKMRMYSMPIDGPYVWTSVTLPADTPLLADGMSVVTDPRTHCFIFFGGELSTFSNATYVLSMEGGPHWTPVLGTAPPARSRHVAVFDPARERMLIFGGRYANGYRNDTWQLELRDTPTWSQTATAIPTGAFTAIPPRADAASMWDTANHRLLVFGGRTASAVLGDFWQLDVDAEAAEWTPVAGPVPAARHSTGTLRDDATGIWWMVGGVDAIGSNVPEAWSYQGALSVVGVGPGSQASPGVALAAPRPNPARASVTLSFSAPPGAQGRLEIFDVRGRRVRMLPVAGGLGASNQIVWDGRGESGRALPTGVYLCRLQAGGQSSTRRVTLLH